MTLIVCPLGDVPGVCLDRRPSHLLTLLSPGSEALDIPASHEPARRLFLAVNDIDEPREGLKAPDAALVDELLAFSADWSRDQPFLVHCWAGVSRSTAAAFAIACQHAPEVPEAAIAWAIRHASPTARPNPLIVALADAALGRQGRMITAAQAIGPGMEAMMGRPFDLRLDAL